MCPVPDHRRWYVNGTLPHFDSAGVTHPVKDVGALLPRSLASGIIQPRRQAMAGSDNALAQSELDDLLRIHGQHG